jgi:hypothetical protein
MSTILDEAKKIVEGDRRNEYGQASKCFDTISKMWSGYLGVNVDSYDVANMMIMLKLVRAKGKGFQRDSFVDIAGYSYCAEIISKENKTD